MNRQLDAPLWREFLRDRLDNDGPDSVKRCITGTTVFSLSEAVSELAGDLARRTDASNNWSELRNLAPLPALDVWIEFDMRALMSAWGKASEYDVAGISDWRAAFTISDWRVDEIGAGVSKLVLVRKAQSAASPTRTLFSWVLECDENSVPMITERARIAAQRFLGADLPMGLYTLSCDHAQKFLIAISAVLAAPGMRERVQRKSDKRLVVRQRETAPVITYTCVDLNVDVYGQWVRSSGDQNNDTARRAYHLVRAHLRTLPGKMVPVRSHWRGDPQRGIRYRDFNVDRGDGDDGGDHAGS